MNNYTRNIERLLKKQREGHVPIPVKRIVKHAKITPSVAKPARKRTVRKRRIYVAREKKNIDPSSMLFNVIENKPWDDQDCWIIGGGPSLKSFDWSTLEGQLVITVNRAF